MQETGAYAFAVVCEAGADRRIATTLADRVLCQEVVWIEPESLDLHRCWQGLAAGSSHLEWHEIRDHAKAAGLKAHGHFRGEPGAPDAYAARLALWLLVKSGQRLDAAVLVRDTDGQRERRLGLEQARTGRVWPFPVLIGLADPKRESWVLAGFEPRDRREREALAQVQREVGSDPRIQADSLSARTPGALREAKRILRALIGDDPDREQACWMECPLEELAERGRLSGLADYLEEVRSRLVPLFTGRG
jgi:hypothetical protein